MWSVRMRASINKDGLEEHISGAEGIFNIDEIESYIKKFYKRAMEHPKGIPDKIVVTIEKLKEPIQTVRALNVKTIFCEDPEEAYQFLKENIIKLGISEEALNTAWNTIRYNKMRGATVIDAKSGVPLEPDKERGVRVSRIQMDKRRKSQVLKKIKNLTSQPHRVIEALSIASKVASLNEVIAEICVSDNPDYTTGYLSSKDLGYLRIMNIKKEGEKIGGRAFFVKTPLNIEKLIYYLEKTPVIVL